LRGKFSIKKAFPVGTNRVREISTQFCEDKKLPIAEKMRGKAGKPTFGGVAQR
jgi:hypothetical protein